RARGLHDEVPLPRDHGVARMAPAVAVGLVEAARWLSCHEEPLHHTVLHERRALRAHSLVVEGVRAGEYRPVERPECRVVIDRDEGGHYLLADLLREGLTLLFLALAVPLYAVAEDLVEEDARRLPLEDRRAGERLGDRGRAQRQQVLHRLLRLRADRVVGREGGGGL